MALTLVPEHLARSGARFTFTGPGAEECAGCPVRHLCLGLVPGTPYEVTALRPASHPCALHEGGRVRVVEVAPTSFPSSVERRHLRGTAVTWSPVPCGTPQCANWKLCHPAGAQPASRQAIAATHEQLACPAGYDVVRVDLLPMAAPA